MTAVTIEWCGNSSAIWSWVGRRSTAVSTAVIFMSASLCARGAGMGAGGRGVGGLGRAVVDLAAAHPPLEREVALAGQPGRGAGQHLARAGGIVPQQVHRHRGERLGGG